MVDVEHDHLGRAAGLAARLDRAGRRVGAAHERHRPGGMAALRQLLLGGAEPREVDARAGAAAEDDALTPDPVEDRVHRVLDREDEARRALRLLLEADVEPHRRVERGELVDEDRLELGLEGLGLLVVREVAALAAPAGGRVDDPADHLAHGALALGRAHAAAEILLRDDVRRGLRPEPGELDALLVERRALLARDERIAALPLDLVERVAARDREVPSNGEAGVLFGNGIDELVGLDHDLAFLCSRHALLLHRRHFLSSSAVPVRTEQRKSGIGWSRGNRTRIQASQFICRDRLRPGPSRPLRGRRVAVVVPRVRPLPEHPADAGEDQHDREQPEDQERRGERVRVARDEPVEEAREARPCSSWRKPRRRRRPSAACRAAQPAWPR